MRIVVATDAWHPQVNGVVRTLTSLQRAASRLGATIEFVTPEGLRTVPLPSYPDIRCAVTLPRTFDRRLEAMRPDAIHIATEGPIGHLARRYCGKRGLPFTTSFTTRFPEYISARLPVPESWSYAWLRRFHAAAEVTMVATASVRADLAARGFTHLEMWTRGVDADLFTPEHVIPLDLPRPIFMTVGRVAVEKNLEAFLALDLPGSKVVIGGGPQEAELRRRFPGVHFLGPKTGRDLAGRIASADVFVFPSLTDTFGVVQLEALACGVPVAAFPVTGPLDVIGKHPVGVLDNDLKAACLAALKISRQSCRAFAMTRSWEASARQFLSLVAPISRTVAAGPTQPAAPASVAIKPKEHASAH